MAGVSIKKGEQINAEVEEIMGDHFPQMTREQAAKVLEAMLDKSHKSGRIPEEKVWARFGLK